MSSSSSITSAERLAVRRTPVLAACLMATFMSAIEATIVATAMPGIVAALGNFNLYSWVFSVYMLSQAVSIPIYGRLADMYGRKRMFYAGTGLFLVASALCGLASDMTLLVVFRALQGLGAGGVQPIASTIVGDIYAPEERARMQGVMSTVYGAAAVAGPSLGVLLVQHAGWQAVFWINLPIGIVALAMVHRFLHETVQPQPRRVDYTGSALLMLAAGALALALSSAGLAFAHGHEMTRLTVLGDTVVGVAALLFLLWHERRAAEPILPLQLWRERIVSAGSLGSGAVGALMMGVCAFLPVYVQGVMGHSAAVSGAVLGAMSVFWTLSAIGSGTLLRHGSYRGIATLGAILLLAGVLELSAMTPQAGVLWPMAGAALLGTGVGLCQTVFLVSIQSSVPWQQRGAATSSVMFLRCLGQAMGAAVLGAAVLLSLQAAAPGTSHTLYQLMAPVRRAELSPPVLMHLAGIAANAITSAYLLGALLAVATCVIAWRLPPGLRPAQQSH
ncbi:MAG: MDR family MFS transporter [Acetobacteraceae bacterium]